MNRYLIPAIATSFLAIVIGAAPAFSASHGTNTHNMQNHGMKNKGTMDHSNMNHDQMIKVQTPAIPTEAGQGAFATVAEIVTILTNDPATDWNKVNIDALREHLIDMDELILRATAISKIDAGKIVFTITGSGRTKSAIQAMVPAHAEVLARTTAWEAKGEKTDTGAILTIASDKPAVLRVVTALGFFGVMATGAHHQAHHLAMAKGESHVHSHN